MLPRFRWIRRHGLFWTAVLAVVLWAGPAAFAQPTIGTAFVTTTDFGTGSYSVIDLETLTVFPDIAPDGIGSDTVVRYSSATKRLYVVNRFGGDSIQVIDPTQGYITPLGAELSVENGSNPQDIALISPTKAYVSRAGRSELLIIDPSSLSITGAIDLANLIKPPDLDNSPEPFRMLVHGDTVYLALQHLDQFQAFQTPLAPGEIVVIDTLTDTVTAVIPLATPNPFSDLQYTAALPRGPRVLVSSSNDFGVLDGGIEAIDPATNTVDAGFILAETAVNGNITFFEVVSATQAYAIVGLVDGSFTNALVQFNPSTGELISTLATGLPFTLNFAINNAGELYVGPVDTVSPTPGVRIFDTVSAQEITTEPLSVGALPPGWIVMVEEP
jgi:DNA-binding beta-propeller fold protein YncE